MKLKDWLKENKDIFSDTDLRFLIKSVVSEYSLTLNEAFVIPSEKEEYLEKVKQSYLKGMPLAYILGKEEFFGLEFKVNKNVLIPRKETEIVTEKALDLIKSRNLKFVLDLCCGCANIAVTIKKKGPQGLIIYACDNSLEALKTASVNVGFHNTEINIVYTDLFAGFKSNYFDLIVSNPPYVEDENIKGSLNYEPRQALAAGEDGMCFIEKILKQAHYYLKSGGYLILEMGHNHRDKVRELAASISAYKEIEWIKDYSGNYRGVVLKNSRNT